MIFASINVSWYLNLSVSPILDFSRDSIMFVVVDASSSNNLIVDSYMFRFSPLMCSVSLWGVELIIV